MAVKKQTATLKRGVVSQAEPANMGVKKASAPPLSWTPAWQAVYEAMNKANTPPEKVKPFLTGDQLSGLIQQLGALNDSDATARRSFKDLQTDTDFQKTQVEDTFRHNNASANDDAAARGLFQSSIRDAALDDLRRTRSTSIDLLDTKLRTADLDINGPNGVLARNEATRKSIGPLDENGMPTGGASLASATENAKTTNANALASFTPAKAQFPTVPGVPTVPGAPKPPSPQFETVTRNDGTQAHHYPATPSSPERWVVLKRKP